MPTKTIKQALRTTRMHWVGDGFPVKTLFSFNQIEAQALSPFLLLDYAGPARFEPAENPRGVGQHPHKGFETVTIVYQGELEHRDSSGGGGTIGVGDVQWMTAGSGIVHEEFHSSKFTKQGGTLEMVQLWVNLPAAKKQVSPRYQTILDSDIPSISIGSQSQLRLIAGSYGNFNGPAKTYTPINVWDISFAASDSVDLEIPQGHTCIVIVLNGGVLIADNEHIYVSGDTLVFEEEGAKLCISSQEGAKLLVLTGEPLNEPVVGYGPFVMNTKTEIKQAIAEYQSGQFGTI